MPIRRRALRALALLLYAAGVLAFLESASRLIVATPPLFERIAAEDDASYRLRWVRAPGRKSHTAYVMDAHHPTRGWTLERNLRGVPGLGPRRLSSNSRGLRGSAEHAVEKPPGVLRIAVLGDSFSFGEDVDDAETYASQLERLVPGSEVLNLGIHGYGHDQMLLYLREEGLRYRPDVVLLGFVQLDVPRNLLAFRDYAKPRFELVDGRLELRNTPVPEPEALAAAEPWRSKLLDLLQMLRARVEQRSGRAEARALALTAAILDEIARASAGAGAAPVFAYLPVAEEMEQRDLAPTPRQRFFLDWCGERGARCLDLRERFAGRARSDAPPSVSGHWNAEEHRLAARALRDGLARLGLLRRPREPGSEPREARQHGGREAQHEEEAGHVGDRGQDRSGGGRGVDADALEQERHGAAE